jgi:hypothetical protein
MNENKKYFLGKRIEALIPTLLFVFLFSTSVFSQGNKADIEDLSISWKDSEASSDSIDIVFVIKIKNPEWMTGVMEIRYGTKEDQADLVYLDLYLLNEVQRNFLVSDNIKFPIVNGLVMVSKIGVEKTYFLKHDKYLNLKLKDRQGEEIKQIAKKEKL